MVWYVLQGNKLCQVVDHQETYTLQCSKQHCLPLKGIITTKERNEFFDSKEL